MTTAEFYIGESAKYIACVSNVGALPLKEQFINILGITYKVKDITWCCDQAESIQPLLRANVILENAT